MAYTTIDDPEKYFSATLYTGNATARTIATGHQSDLVWLKRRDGAAGHRIADSVRGATKLLYSDSTTNEQTDSDSITGFVSTGFTLGDDGGGFDVNTNTNTMVAWSWKETADAGFDIVSYTGTGSNTTVSHGLSAVPNMIIVKDRDGARNWTIYHKSIGSTKWLQLDGTSAAQTGSPMWQDTDPTSSVFSIGTYAQINTSSSKYIAYCFKNIQGFSKFGSYKGGTLPFIYLGFKPAYFLLKEASATNGYEWVVFDNKRDSNNPIGHRLNPSHDRAEYTDLSDVCDFNSNGLKFRAQANNWCNTDGRTYIYMAFAEAPFVNSKGVPANAR